MSTKAIQVESLWSGLLDDEGNPISGGKVFTYASGTTTLTALYLDRDKISNATNPIILDTYGRAEVFGDGVYKFVVKDADDNILYDIDGLEYLAREAGSLDSTVIGGTTPAAGTFTDLGFTNYLAYKGQTIDAGVAIRDIVYYTSAGWLKADLLDIGQKIFGMYISANTVLIKGLVTGFVGLVVDSKYYLQTTGAISTVVSRIFVGTAKSTTSLFVDIQLTSSSSSNGSGNANSINSLEQMIRVEKNNRLQVEDSQVNIVRESFINPSTSNLVLDTTITHSQSNASVTLNTSQVEGYVYDTMLVTETKTLTDMYYSIAQNTNTIFNVSTGNSTTQTLLTSASDRHTELKQNDYVWFVPFRRLKATTTDTKWIQTSGSIRTKLTADGTGSTDITITHEALATQLPAYDDDQLKYVCFPEHASAAYKVEANSSTALTAYTKSSPSGYTPIIFDKVCVKDYGIPYHQYLFSHWKCNELSGDLIDVLHPAGTYNFSQVGTVPSTTGKIANSRARGPMSASNRFQWTTNTTTYGLQVFAVGFWFKLTTLGNYGTIMAQQPEAQNAGWSFQIRTDNKLNSVYNGSVLPGSTTLSAGVWYHAYFAQLLASGANNRRIYLNASIDMQNTGAAISYDGSATCIGNVLTAASTDGIILSEGTFWNTMPSTWAEFERLIALEYSAGIGRGYGSNLGQIFSSSVEGVSANAGDRISFASGITRNAGLANAPSLEHYAYKL